MKPHSARTAPTKAAIVCMVALSRGNLRCIGRHWLFEDGGKHRLFSTATVNGLIALGMVERYGDLVTAAW